MVVSRGHGRVKHLLRKKVHMKGSVEQSAGGYGVSNGMSKQERVGATKGGKLAVGEQGARGNRERRGKCREGLQRGIMIGKVRRAVGGLASPVPFRQAHVMNAVFTSPFQDVATGGPPTLFTATASLLQFTCKPNRQSAAFSHCTGTSGSNVACIATRYGTA